MSLIRLCQLSHCSPGVAHFWQIFCARYPTRAEGGGVSPMQAFRVRVHQGLSGYCVYFGPTGMSGLHTTTPLIRSHPMLPGLAIFGAGFG